MRDACFEGPAAMKNLSPTHISAAHRILDPTFRDSPQRYAAELSRQLDLSLVLKDETQNPIRSFKGRGADFFVSQLEGSPELVCGSAGNFGQGLAYAARRRGLAVTVFAAESANPQKVDYMRALGARVILSGADFDAAKEAAAAYATTRNARFVEDGREPAIAEGAGTVALELCSWPEPFDVVLVPLGNGALACGMGCWLKAKSPGTRVIGVVAAGAPSMSRSFRSAQPVTTTTAETIADGIAVRLPIPEAVAALPRFVDEVLEVSEASLLEAMRALIDETGRLIEPAGAAGLAALLQEQGRFRGQRVATPLCGGHVTEEQARQWQLL